MHDFYAVPRFGKEVRQVGDKDPVAPKMIGREESCQKAKTHGSGWQCRCNYAAIRVADVRISIVISARSGPAPVLSALQSLADLPQYGSLEVTVANCCGPGTECAIARSYPEVKIVNLPAGTSIADSRHAAIQRSSGEVIAVLHERYCAPKNWAERLDLAHAGEAAEVIAGCVAPSAGMSNAEWAIFLSEYAHACPPMPSGPLRRSAAMMVPGGNASYKRAALQKVSMKGCLWELDFHAALFDSRARFHRDQELIAEFGWPYTVREYIAERARLSHDFAARRAAKMPPIFRLTGAASRIALPPLAIARVAVALLRKRVHTGRFLLALPWIAAFALVQGWGQVTGYLAKRPPLTARGRD